MLRAPLCRRDATFVRDRPGTVRGIISSAGSRRTREARGYTNRFNTSTTLDHFHLRNVVCPVLVPEESRDLAAQVEGASQEWGVDFQPSLIALVSASACVRVLCVFEL